MGVNFKRAFQTYPDKIEQTCLFHVVCLVLYHATPDIPLTCISHSLYLFIAPREHIE